MKEGIVAGPGVIPTRFVSPVVLRERICTKVRDAIDARNYLLDTKPLIQHWAQLRCRLALLSLLWSCLCLCPFAWPQEGSASSPTIPRTTDTSPATPPQPTDPGQTPAAASTGTAAIQQEVGDRDITYLRDRIVFRYDYKLQVGPTEKNRFRLKLLDAFGPHHRFAVSVSVPLMYGTAPNDSAFGSGDTEIVMGGNMYRGERFRMGATFQVTAQTSSENLLGGSTTTIKPAWGFINVLSERLELTSAFYYKQSIHTVRGNPAKQFEPDITLNARMRRVTWFLEYDSFYDFIPEKYAQTMKIGFSRRFGSEKHWVASAYYSAAINDYGTVSQYKYNPGFDLTWYPFRSK